jgi:hypothetical protein
VLADRERSYFSEDFGLKELYSVEVGLILRPPKL